MASYFQIFRGHKNTFIKYVTLKIKFYYHLRLVSHPWRRSSPPKRITLRFVFQSIFLNLEFRDELRIKSCYLILNFILRLWKSRLDVPILALHNTTLNTVLCILQAALEPLLIYPYVMMAIKVAPHLHCSILNLRLCLIILFLMKTKQNISL